ncbi:hypothetical protein [Saccharococcus thermophilus]|uniref:hypothetical protein n=1 Tax=Saccharococcus thermophilus TaxID=29396 RepID=UPI0036D24956
MKQQNYMYQKSQACNEKPGFFHFYIARRIIIMFKAAKIRFPPKQATTTMNEISL